MRSHLLLLLALAVLSSHVVIEEDRSDESKLIEKIRLLGGNVERDDKLPGHPVVGVSFEGSERVTDNYIHLLKAFQNLARLDLSGTRITDAGLKELPELKNLVELYVFETGVTPAGLAELRESSPKLSIFDESTIQHLEGKVERDEKSARCSIIGLSFAGSRSLSDKSMRLLKSLNNLTTLILSDTQITDVGLKELRRTQESHAAPASKHPDYR